MKDSRRGIGGEHFRRIQSSGWSLAETVGEASYFGPSGHGSVLDHLLHTAGVGIKSAEFVAKAGKYVLAGRAGGLSDHTALVAELGT